VSPSYLAAWLSNSLLNSKGQVHYGDLSVLSCDYSFTSHESSYWLWFARKWQHNNAVVHYSENYIHYQ